MNILFPHNQAAYDALLSMVEEYGKACVVHPTGTGKSFIGFHYAAEHTAEDILWLAPSQYIFDTQMENWKKAGGAALPNLTFLTYAKLSILSEEEILTLRPHTCVADELHRLGAEVWGRAFQQLLITYPNLRLIGLTATNVRYLDAQRDMAQELFDGHIASEMSLGEAIVRGILPAPKYVLSIFKYRDDLAKYELRAQRAKSRATRDAAEEILEKLRRALEMAEGMDEIFSRHMTDRNGKYLVFCANAEHMGEMISHVPEWFHLVDENPHVYYAYSDDPSTSASFASFKADRSDHLKLLFCIDMLNEGVHVDDVSGVILLRPTVSPIVYKQQIGRALSSSSTNTPVIFDVVMNIENLYSISSVQEEMEVALTYYRSLGDFGEVIVDHFDVIDEVRDALELFDRLNETLTASWDIMYDQAEKYYRENGDLLVPGKYTTEEGYSLGQWLETQRKVRAGKTDGALTAEKIARLDAIGMRWESVADLNWEKYYAAAKTYKEQNGDLYVKKDYVTESGLLLGSWMNNLRTYRKNGMRNRYLTPERIRMLDELGMLWDVKDHLFERNYSAAEDYFRTHGDLNIPVEYVDENGIRLGQWIANLRSRERMGTLGLDEEQRASLDSLGMIWGNRNDLAWERGFQIAARYYEEHGTLPERSTYQTADGFKLGDWVVNQREKYRAGVMKQERIDRLNTIGMVWELPTPWELRFHLAEQYYQDHGNLRMPADYVVDGVWLSKWLDEQRQARKGRRKKPLTEEQIARLDAIGMVWEKKIDLDWNENFEEAKEWVEKQGEIPQSIISRRGIQLYKWWVINLRKAKQGTLSEDKIRKIENLANLKQSDS